MYFINKIENKNPNLKNDLRLSIYIVIYFVLIALNGSLKHIFKINESQSSFLSIMIGAVILFFILLGIRIVLKRNSKIILFSSLFIFTLLYVISFIFADIYSFPLKPLINKSLIPTFLWYIPLGVLVFSINNKEILYKILLKSSYFISAIVFIVFIQIFVGNSEEIKNYNMFFSYTLLLPTLIHITEFVRTKKKYLLFLSLFEILEILIYGARGPLLWIIIFSFFVIFINKNKIKKTFLVAITVFAIFIFINTDSFLLYLTKQLDYYDINSRTITLLTSNDITLLSSRDLIWNSSISLILEKPILGYGLGNEFYAISNDMNMGRDEIVSPHNGILQLALNFGILSGVILSVLIIISFFIIRKINNVFHRNLLLIFFFAFILPSITVGDGLLTKPGAAVYFYLFLNYIFQKNKYQNEIKLQKKIIHN